MRPCCHYRQLPVAGRKECQPEGPAGCHPHIPIQRRAITLRVIGDTLLHAEWLQRGVIERLERLGAVEIIGAEIDVAQRGAPPAGE
jgi:hypothetical protein